MNKYCPVVLLLTFTPELFILKNLNGYNSF
jgi:hypothetical protein